MGDRFRKKQFQEMQKDLQEQTGDIDDGHAPKKVSLVVVLDISGSMGDLSNGGFRVFRGTLWNLVKLPIVLFSGSWDEWVEDVKQLYQSKLSECQRTLCDQLRANRSSMHEVALIAFNHGIESCINFTQDVERVLTEIESLEPFGDTALYTSVVAAYEMLIAKRDSGHVGQLFVLTDGCDNCSLEEHRRQVQAISQLRPAGSSDECQAFLISLAEGHNDANQTLAQQIGADYQGVSAASFLQNSDGSAAIETAFDHMKKHRSHHQRQRCRRWKDRVQCATDSD